MLWGHFGMCARVLRAARSWPAHAAPRSSPVFAGSRSSSMSGAAGGVSHGSVVSVVGNVPSCVPGDRDASREDLQIGVDDAGLYVVLIKQLLHCVLIKQLLIARAVSKRLLKEANRALAGDASENLARALGIAGGVFDTARWPDAVIAQATCDVRHT
jgi:hypothetical protein